MTWLAEAHNEWHTVNGAYAVCPLDCGAGEQDYQAEQEAAELAELGADRYQAGTAGRVYAVDAAGRVVATLTGANA